MTDFRKDHVFSLYKMMASESQIKNKIKPILNLAKKHAVNINCEFQRDFISTG